MIRCFNCQRKIFAGEEICPYCERDPWSMLDTVTFAVGKGALLRYNGSDAEVTVPDGIHTIAEMAFEDTAVKQVSLPDGVEEIEPYAFYSCYSLHRVDIPKSVKRIGSHAFGECPYLRFVALDAACEVAADAFPPETEIYFL